MRGWWVCEACMHYTEDGGFVKHTVCVVFCLVSPFTCAGTIISYD